MSRVNVLCVVLVTSICAQAWAQSPNFIPVQGYLTDNQDNPVDQELSMTLELIKSSDPDNPLFTKTQTVQVEKGYFTVFLGMDNDPPLDLSWFKDNQDLQLRISIGAVPLEPPLSIGTIPYAGFSAYSGSVDWSSITSMPADLDQNGITTGAVGISEISDGAVTPSKIDFATSMEICTGVGPCGTYRLCVLYEYRVVDEDNPPGSGCRVEAQDCSGGRCLWSIVALRARCSAYCFGPE